MGTFTKIKTLPLTNLNNAEYLAFLNSVLDLVPAPTGGGDPPQNESPSIGFSAQVIQTF